MLRTGRLETVVSGFVVAFYFVLTVASLTIGITIDGKFFLLLSLLRERHLRNKYTLQGYPYPNCCLCCFMRPLTRVSTRTAPDQTGGPSYRDLLLLMI